MWCDSFDADLLKVVPGAAEALGDMASLDLLTHGGETGRKLNHPAVWNDYEGMVAFFWTPAHPEFGRPDGYVTDQPVVECTLLEAVRDAWSHTYVIAVNRIVILRPDWQRFEQLMNDTRGHQPLPDVWREQIREHVREALRLAARQLTWMRDGGVL